MRIENGGTIIWDDAEVPAKADRKAWDKKYDKSVKGKKRRRQYNLSHPSADYLTREFIAYDGEGITIEDGSHLYTLFASSHGLSLTNDEGLSTREIFESLIDAKRQYPDAIHVIYGGSYDFNMWFGDISIPKMIRLYETGSTLWQEYRITWRRGKSLRITDRTDNTTIMVYDVVSFFQRPFVQACDEYLGEDEYWQSVRDMIVSNKATRGKFTVEDNAAVRDYNQSELRLLVHLMSELRARLNRVQLRPARWDGPGAIATALMQREQIKNHMHQCPIRVAEGGRYAYFGGRFEMLKNGDVWANAWEYDINSAYPSALRHVPNLSRGEWGRARKSYGHEDFAIFRITWETADDWPLRFPNPFPARYPNGTVYFPRRVTGWYWAPEVWEAEFSHAGTLTIHEGWRFHPQNKDDKPFAFVEPMYLKRQALKKAKDGAHVGIKLGLNSLYGKTCQRIGWRPLPDGGVHTPPFHQLEWAGYVTSHCRANLFHAALQNPDALIAFETDALFMREEISLDTGSGLGQWEETVFNHLAYAQSGFYFGEIDHVPFVKTRGVDRGSLSYSDIEGRFFSEEPWIDAKLTRFNGAGLAKLHNNWGIWRRWETVPKRVTLDPVGKRVHRPETCYACHEGWENAWHECVVPIPNLNMIESCAFPIPWINPDPDMPDESLAEDYSDEMSLAYE